MRYSILLLFFSAGFWACQPNEACISSATSLVVIDFRVDSVHVTGTAAGSLVRRDSLFRDNIALLRVTSTTSQSVFWMPDSAVSATSRVLLALDPERDETTFLFEYQDQEVQNDTLILGYQRRYRLISPDCPLEVSFRDLQVVYTSFDSTFVINTELMEPNNEEDIQIIRPRQQ